MKLYKKSNIYHSVKCKKCWLILFIYLFIYVLDCILFLILLCSPALGFNNQIRKNIFDRVPQEYFVESRFHPNKITKVRLLGLIVDPIVSVYANLDLAWT